MINWTLEKFVKVREETGSSWRLFENIFNYSGLSAKLNRVKNRPTEYNFISKYRNSIFTNENLTDTLVPFITSLGEFARDNGNKEFHQRMINLIEELKK